MSLSSLDTFANAITAGTTQTLAGATAITANVTQVTTGNANDGVLLPNLAPGQIIAIKNLSANAGKMYVNNGGTIDGTAGATGVALTASKTTLVAGTGYTAGTNGTAVTMISLGNF